MTDLEFNNHRELVSRARKLQRLRKDKRHAVNEYSKVTADIELDKERLKALEKAENALLEYENALGIDVLADVERYLATNKRRWMRVRDGVKSILSNTSVVLVTLTFRDDVLSVTSETTRRTYVRKFLSSQSDTYMANRDFGSKRGREHFHALVVCDNIDRKGWNYGTINFKRVNLSEERKNTVGKLSRYIDKLSNHALKETVGDRIIWSRKKHPPQLEELCEVELLEWLDSLGG